MCTQSLSLTPNWTNLASKIWIFYDPGTFLSPPAVRWCSVCVQGFEPVMLTTEPNTEEEQRNNVTFFGIRTDMFQFIRKLSKDVREFLHCSPHEAHYLINEVDNLIHHDLSSTSACSTDKNKTKFSHWKDLIKLNLLCFSYQSEAGLGIRSFAHFSFAQRLWVNGSFFFLAHLLFRSQKRAIRSKQFDWNRIFFLVFCLFFVSFKNERFAHCLFFNELIFGALRSRCERIVQVAHQKWAMWVKRSGRSPKMSEWANCSLFWANRSFAHYSLIFFSRKKRAIRWENRWANSQPWSEDHSILERFRI